MQRMFPPGKARAGAAGRDPRSASPGTLDADAARGLRQAAEMAGGALLFVLPARGTDGAVEERAVVRLGEGDGGRLIAMPARDGRVAVNDGASIDGDLAAFARAWMDVLQRLSADERVTAPLAGANAN